MEKKCNECRIEQHGDGVVNMSEWAYEMHEARHERQMKRMWIALLVTISMLFASIIGFIWYESQFETYSYDQNGDGINNVNNGEQGDIVNEPTVEDKKETGGDS